MRRHGVDGLSIWCIIVNQNFRLILLPQSRVLHFSLLLYNSDANIYLIDNLLTTIVIYIREFTVLGVTALAGRCHGSNTLSPSRVTVDTENVKTSVSAGWRQEGHPARKTSHRKPLISRDNRLTPVYLGK